MKLLFMLLLVASLAYEAQGATHPGPRRARARQAWRGFSGPAYLPPGRPRRPGQHVLDSLARAATRRQSLTTNRAR